jgi:hypothetical protein
MECQLNRATMTNTRKATYDGTRPVKKKQSDSLVRRMWCPDTSVGIIYQEMWIACQGCQHIASIGAGE